MTRRRGLLAGFVLGMNSGWNVGNLGAVASELARVYGVGLATVGLFTSALFLTHMAIQVPGGRASDRFGPVRTGTVALLVIAAGDLVALTTAEPAIAIVARALTGVGTGLVFICGSALVRESGGSPLAQGLFGGIALGAGGLALAVVGQLAPACGWRTPYWSSLALAAIALVVVARRGAPPLVRRVADRRRAPGVLGDRRLYRLAILYSASFGLSSVLGNWAVELLARNGALSSALAGGVAALPLGLCVATRPLGGWILRRHPRLARMAVGASLACGALGTAAQLIADRPWIALAGGLLLGAGAGIPYSPAFTGAALLRPDAPTASVGMVNSAACLVVLVGTPLVGLTFSVGGSGRIAFAAIAALWLLALTVLPSRVALGAA